MIKNKNIEWLKENPFKIFRISDFLHPNEYEKLSDNFPDFESIKKENFFKFENNKFAITSGSNEYNEIILKNEILSNFHNLINSNNFKKIFFYNIFKEILFSRNMDFKHIYKSLRIPKFVNKIDKNLFSKYFSIFSQYKITIQYSYILNQGKIVPHPDAGDKVLTLLFFFPQYQDDQNNKKIRERESEYGTTFWNSNFKNFNDKHIKDLNDQVDFKENSKIYYQTKFKKNEIYGFLKNKYSWHSVEPIDVYDKYVRKSININIYY